MMISVDTDKWRDLLIQAQAWARVLRLPFRSQRWRGQSGEFQGMGVGSSLDFQDHRAYVPGDDPRQINWQAYARTGSYTMKLYREEVRPLVDIALDVSASMFAFPPKQQRVLELVAFALESSFLAGAAVRFYGIHGHEHRLLDLASIRSGKWLLEMEDLISKSTPHAPLLGAIPWRPTALRVLICDLLFPGDPERWIHALAQGQGRGMIWAPIALEESNPGWAGNYEFEDVETTSLFERRVEPDLLDRYHLAYVRHFELWKMAAAKHGLALARVPAEGAFLASLRAEGVPTGALEIA